MKKLFHKIEEVIGVYRWHPKIALRYLPIVEEIKRQKITNPTILEVGSGSLGIAPYLKQKVVGVDVDFSGPTFSLLEQKKGSILQLPFAKDSFDVVLCVDVLEHLPKEKRMRAISELVRVAKKECIIALPCGEESALQDQKVAWEYEKRFNRTFEFCIEHVTFGLPTQEEIISYIKKSVKGSKKHFVLSIKGNINLRLRYFLMRGWMTKNILVDFFFRKLLLLVVPLLRTLNQEPTYRKIFFIRFNQ